MVYQTKIRHVKTPVKVSKAPNDFFEDFIHAVRGSAENQRKPAHGCFHHVKSSIRLKGAATRNSRFDTDEIRVTKTRNSCDNALQPAATVGKGLGPKARLWLAVSSAGTLCAYRASEACNADSGMRRNWPGASRRRTSIPSSAGLRSTRQFCAPRTRWNRTGRGAHLG